MQKKDTRIEKKITSRRSPWFYWPYWILVVLIVLLLFLLIKSNERSNSISRELNEEPVSTKQ